MSIVKNISVLGIGRLGLCFSLVLEKAGYNVMGLDIKKDYINAINKKTIKSIEPKVEEYLKCSKNFKATLVLKEAIDYSDILFVTVKTESLPSGKYDHSQVKNLINNLILLGEQEFIKYLVISCNVCPGYSNEIQEQLRKYNYVVSYNPEWVAQGSIIYNQEFPDVVVIGGGDKKASFIIENIYKTMCLNNPPIHHMNRLSAEITKLSLNCYLTTKITYANMVGEIAIESGVDPEPILAAIGEDSRINSKYFKYGFGYGGPCFPRDVRALMYYAKKIGIQPHIVSAVKIANANHLDFQIKEFIKTHSKEDPIVFESITYKPGTIILEESQQLFYAFRLAEMGYTVIIKEHVDVIKKLEEIYGTLFIYVHR